MAADPKQAGDRIEALLQKLQSSLDGPTMADVEEVLSLVTGLYGAGLARTVDVLQSTDGGDAVVTRLTEDELVATLLVLHDLHPEIRASDFDPPTSQPPADVWTSVALQHKPAAPSVPTGARFA